MNKKTARILFFVLCLLLACTAAVGCDEVATDPPVTDGEQGDTVTDPDRDPPSEQEPQEDVGYLQIRRGRIVSYQKLSFFFEADDTVLTLSLPRNWTAKADGEGGYAFLRAGREVAHLRSESVSADDAVAVKSVENGALRATRVLTADPDAASLEETYAYCFSYAYVSQGEVRTVTFRTRYAELDDKAEEFLLTEAHTESRCRGLGMLSGETLRKHVPIMVLGNSFINSSQVATTANQMLTGTGYHVQGVSVSYAEVSHSWSSYLEPMRQGAYAAVFMCGFYGQDDVETLDVYAKACAESDTPLIIFPAHNERMAQAAATQYSHYENVYFLDWKGDLDDLLAAGVPEELLCVDDGHKHSTPLAGYVGAHMIYRALMGKLPSRFGGISQTLVKNGLGAYHTQGYADGTYGQTRLLLSP